MYFEESYFQGEEREGFFVEEKMKRAWAAQIEVLKELERICKKYGLNYYAGYGTLLGAVRHKGFIPWDDDMDIFMLRDEYEQFLGVVQQEMPKEYALLNIYTEESYGEVFSRIVNNRRVDFSEEHMKRFHWCPYAVGIDIFPLDFLSRNPQEVEMQYGLYQIILNTKTVFLSCENEALQDEEEINQEEMLQQIEELCNVKIDRTKPIIRQLIILLDRISSLYKREESDEVAIIHSNLQGYTGRFKKEWFGDAVWLPFENTEISVPHNYCECAKSIYGPDYMTPVCYQGHEYPFYKKQERLLEAAMKDTEKQ